MLIFHSAFHRSIHLIAVHQSKFPNIEADLFLAYVGMETDLLFNHGIDLPGFASYPLLESNKGRALLKTYFSEMIALGREKGMGVVLESPTWVANRDRGVAIGYAPKKLMQLNKQAVALMSEVRSEIGDVPTVISANVGPRDDAYAPSAQMSADAAVRYHSEQISVLAKTDADVISGYTLAYSAEAVGIVRAASR